MIGGGAVSLREAGSGGGGNARLVGAVTGLCYNRDRQRSPRPRCPIPIRWTAPGVSW